MPGYALWLILAVNVITLVGGLIAAIKWFKKWLVKTVSDPIQSSLDSFSQILEHTRQEAFRANERLDRHLEVHSNA